MQILLARYLHAFAIALDRVRTDYVELTLIELNYILFCGVTEDVLAHTPEHKHLESVWVVLVLCLVFSSFFLLLEGVLCIT